MATRPHPWPPLPSQQDISPPPRPYASPGGADETHSPLPDAPSPFLHPLAWLEAQRDASYASGNLDPATGLPTAKALREGFAQYPNALVMGTTAPGEVPAFPLVPKLNPEGAGLAARATGQDLVTAGRNLLADESGGVPFPGGKKPGEPAPIDTPVPGPDPTAPGADKRVSTRVPYGKEVQESLPYDPHEAPHYEADIGGARDSEEAFHKNAMNMRGGDYPDLPVKGLRNPESIINTAVDHMVDNITAMHDLMVDQFGQANVDRARVWYNGGNNIVHDGAAKHGYEPENVAGAYANLSPQKDWDQNVSLGDRLIDIVTNRANTPTSPEMMNWANKYLQGVNAKVDKNAAKLDAAKAADPDADWSKKDAGIARQRAAADDLEMSINGMRGRKFSEINDPDTRAIWVRAYDEAHNPRDYNVITPEGGKAETATTDKGKPEKVAWGSFNEISKAIQALQATDLPSLSRTLGRNHKVRSFYNNLIAPDAGSDLTNDTHAIAVAHWRPLSGEDTVTAQGLGTGGSSDANTGSRGSYGVYAHAYRLAAQKLGMLPRELQSIVWSGVRGLFTDVQKRNKDFWNENYDIWSRFKNGDITAEQARDMVLRHARGEQGRLIPPKWMGPIPPQAPTE